MGAIKNIKNPWREILLSIPASFRGIAFYVETGTRTSGRRTVVHEYPKRNDPYAEDMGRHARRWTFSGYLIHREHTPNGFSPYVQQRRALLKALEKDDIGWLIHPVFAPEGTDAMCERYSMVESRERGGYTQFEMSFVEHGKPGNSVIQTDTTGTVMQRSTAAEQAAVTANNFTIDEAQRTGWPSGPQAAAVATPFEPTSAESHVIASGIAY